MNAEPGALSQKSAFRVEFHPSKLALAMSVAIWEKSQVALSPE